jgi:hypothetical protein
MRNQRTPSIPEHRSGERCWVPDDPSNSSSPTSVGPTCSGEALRKHHPATHHEPISLDEPRSDSPQVDDASALDVRDDDPRRLHRRRPVDPPTGRAASGDVPRPTGQPIDRTRHLATRSPDRVCPGQDGARKAADRAMEQYHQALQIKYHEASLSPWWPVESAPPPPE